MEGMENLVSLEQAYLSHNGIDKIEGLGNCVCICIIIKKYLYYPSHNEAKLKQINMS